MKLEELLKFYEHDSVDRVYIEHDIRVEGYYYPIHKVDVFRVERVPEELLNREVIKFWAFMSDLCVLIKKEEK